MADRYWRGSAGTWSTVLTTNWATTSGAVSGGASVPTAADNVFFDQAGTYTVTMTGALLCANITVSAGTVTFATGTTPTLAVSGSMSLIAGTVWNSTGTVTFNATSAQSISNNAVNMDCPITFNGVGGTWTLGSNFAYGKTAIRAMNLTNGTVNGNGFTITSLFASTIATATNTNTLQNISTTLATTVTSGTITVNGTFGAFTFTAGTLNLGGALTTAAFTFTAGTLNLNNYTLTSTTFAATGATTRTFAYGTGNITCTGSGTAFTQATPGTLTVTGTPVVNITNATATATTVASGIVTEAQAPSFNFSGGAYSLTFLGTASYAANNVTFTTNTAGTAPWAGTWAATSTGTIYGSLTLSSAMTLTVSTSVLTFGGVMASTKTISPAGKGMPIPLTFNSPGSTYQFTSGMSLGVTTAKAIIFTAGTFDFNNQSITLGFAGSTISTNTNTISISNVVSSTNIPFTVTSGTCNLTTCNFGSTVTFTAGTFNLTDSSFTGAGTLTAGTLNLLSNTTIGGIFTYTAGTLNITDFTFTVGAFLATGATVRTIAYGSTGTGNIVCTGSGTAWSQATPGTLTVTGNPVVYITNATTTATTVASGILTEAQAPSFTFSGGAYTLTFLAVASYVAENVTFVSGWAGTWAATSTATIFGSLTLSSAMTLTASASAMTFGGAVVATKTIDPAGKAIDFPLTFNSAGSTYQFTSGMTVGATAARAVIFTAGIFDIGNQAIIFGFAGSTWSMNTNTIAISNVSTNTNMPFTITSGTCNLTNCTFGGGVTFTAGTLNLLSDTTIGGAFTFTAGTININDWNFTVKAFLASGATTRVVAYGPNGTGNITCTSRSGNVWDQSTIGTFSYTGTSIVNITNSGASDSISATGTIGTIAGTGPWTAVITGMVSTAGLNVGSSITATNGIGSLGGGAGTYIITSIVNSTSVNYTATGGTIPVAGTVTNIITTTSITVAPGVATEAQSQNFNFFSPSAAYTVTFLGTASHAAKNVNFQSFGGTWAAISTGTLYGNLTLTSAMTITSSASALTFAGASETKTISSSGCPINFPIILNSIGSTFTGDTLVMGATAAKTLTLVNGTLDWGTYTISGFAGSTFSTNTNSVTVQNVTMNLTTTITSGTCTIGSVTTFGSTFTLTSGTLTLGDNLTIVDAFTLTAGTINLSGYGVSVSTYTATGAATRVINFGLNPSSQVPGYINVTAISGVVWNTATPGTFSYTGTSDIRIGGDPTSGNTVTVNTGAMTEAQALNFSIYGGGNAYYTLNFLNTAGYTAKSVSFANAGYVFWNCGGGTIYGDLNAYTSTGSGVVPQTSASALTFGGSATSGTRYISNTINPFQQPIIFNSPGSTWTLQSNFTNYALTTLTAGTLDFGGAGIITGSFNSSGAVARTLNWTSGGSLTCNGYDVQATGGTIYTTATLTNFSVTNPENSNIIIQPYIGGGFVYTVATGAGTEAQAMNFTFYSGQQDGGGWTLTFLGTASYSARNVNFGSFGGTWAAISTGIVYGEFYWNGGATTVSTSALTFAGTSGTKSIYTGQGDATNPINFPITFNGVGSTWVLNNSALFMASNKLMTLTNGTLNLNSQYCQVGTFATGAGTKSLVFQAGALDIIGSGTTAFNNANPTGFTVAHSSNLTWYGVGGIYMSSAAAKTFVGGGSNFSAPFTTTNAALYGASQPGSIYLYNNGAGTLTISGNNTFYRFTNNNTTTTTTTLITGSNTFIGQFLHATYSGLAATYTFTSGTTQNFGAFYITGDGTGPNVVINTSTAGTQATLNLDITSWPAYSSYIQYTNIRDIFFGPVDATGSGLITIQWYAGGTTVNTSNNSGGIVWYDWIGYYYYVITNTSITSWTAPNTMSASLSVYLIGAGGGGGGSTSSGSLYRSSGGGGGGAGHYNFSLNTVPGNTTFPIQVGIGGTGGAGASSASGDAISLGTAGTATKFGTILTTLYAASFNGTTQYLQMPAAFPTLTTLNFCIEAWVYPTSFANSPIIVEHAYQNSSDQGGWRVGLDTGGVVGFYLAGLTPSSGFTRIQSTVAIPLNQWSHIAVSRASGSYQGIFVNGTHSAFTYQALSLAQNSGGTQTNYACRIGGAIIDSAFVQGFTGRISNVRILNNSAGYNQNFSPSRTILTNTGATTTRVLTCAYPSDMDNTGTNTIYDGSTNNSGIGWSITNVGNVATSRDNVYLPYIAPGGGAGSSLAFVSGVATATISGDGGYNVQVGLFGGDGGIGSTTTLGAYAMGGGGGGGASGAYGNGGYGGNAFTASLTATQASGGGGGGAAGGTAGGNGTATTGGAGGYNYLTLGRGTGTAAAGNNGTNGGGGGGGQNLSPGGNSANYIGDYINTFGPSGGAGGSAGANATNTVGYGGGGGGAGQTTAASPGTPQNGGNGGNGLIVILNQPRSALTYATNTSTNFFDFFWNFN
jgi:hypothetical protein